MLIQSCDDDPPPQELGSPDSSSLDYLLDSPRCTVPWQQDRTASPGDAIGLDDNSLPDSRDCPQVPTTQTLARLREILQSSDSIFMQEIIESLIALRDVCLKILAQLSIIDLLYGGEAVQLDSSEQQSLVEFDATNNGHIFSPDHSNFTGSHSRKNTDHSKNKTIMTLEIRCRNKIKPSLEDIEQQFGNKREDAAKNLDISVSTLKRICRKWGINQWPFCKEKNKESHKGMGVRSGQGTSSSAQAARSAKRPGPTVPASSSRKRIRSNSQIVTKGTTSTEYAMAKSTDPIIHEIDEYGGDGRTLHQLTHWSQPLMLSLGKEKYSGFHISHTSVVETKSEFTDFEEQTREVEGNKGKSAVGEYGMKEEEKVEGEPSRGNFRGREKLEEDHDEVQCREHIEREMQDADEVQYCEHLEIEMQDAELAENIITLPASQPCRMLNLQGAVGAASAAAGPAFSGQASNNVTRQPHQHEISKKSQFLGFEVSSNAFHLLMQIQQRFPETFTSFKIKRPEWAVSMLGNLAEFVKSVADTKVHEMSEETMQTMHGSLKDLETMGFSLPWLKARLEDGTKVKDHDENNLTYEYSANALEKINGDIKELDEDYTRASSKLKATKEKLEVETAKAKAGLEASGRDQLFSLSIGDSLLKDIIM